MYGALMLFSLIPLCRQWSTCSGQQIPQLSGMVDILGQVCQDPQLKSHLASEPPPGRTSNELTENFNSPDIKSLKERLLKEVVSSSNAQIVASKPKPKSLFDSRPHLTANFVFPGSQQRGSNLSGVPASSQESILLSELLYTLLGNNADHIVPSRTQKGEGKFSLDRDMDLSLQALIERLLPLATDYSAVVSWCEETGPAEGLVNTALVAGINLLLSDYTLLVCQLEQSLAQGELTLHRLHHQLQPSKHCMEVLASLVREVAARQARGGATLSVLHSRLLHCGSDPKSAKIVQFLTELAARPFFETLSLWLYRGVIVDRGRTSS